MKYRISDNEREFTARIPALLKDAEQILANLKLANQLVDVNNGTAQTGAYCNPTLGGYLDWWINCPEYSRDKNGRFIWKLTGSLLSGAHACQAVDENGVSYPAELNHHFNTTYRSFIASQRKYRP
ncbi:MAG: hypothetical protein NC248_12110 [Bacteroides sp.]|nr:hypothetical protein [Bacteroides sp.]